MYIPCIFWWKFVSIEKTNYFEKALFISCSLLCELRFIIFRRKRWKIFWISKKDFYSELISLKFFLRNLWFFNVRWKKILMCYYVHIYCFFFPFCYILLNKCDKVLVSICENIHLLSLNNKNIEWIVSYVILRQNEIVKWFSQKYSFLAS